MNGIQDLAEKPVWNLKKVKMAHNLDTYHENSQVGIVCEDALEKYDMTFFLTLDGNITKKRHPTISIPFGSLKMIKNIDVCGLSRP